MAMTIAPTLVKIPLSIPDGIVIIVPPIPSAAYLPQVSALGSVHTFQKVAVVIF